MNSLTIRRSELLSVNSFSADRIVESESNDFSMVSKHTNYEITRHHDQPKVNQTDDNE